MVGNLLNVITMKPAVFLERDGILNRYTESRLYHGSPLTVEEFRVIEEVKAPLTQLKEAGFLLIVTTNQPGVCEGALPRRELDMMHRILNHKLPLDDILICPHEESDPCPCHKPEIGMFQEASHKHHIPLDQSFVISDKWSDAEAALNMGGTSVMVRSDRLGDGHHDYVTASFEDAVQKVLMLHEEALAHHH